MRRQMGREGLATFGTSDINRALEEAFLLIQYAFLARTTDADGSGVEAVKRAAEILEWLSQADLRPVGSPLHLLSAAAYQLAGYPAMALGELKRVPGGDTASAILAGFLSADFPSVLRSLRIFWQQELAGADLAAGRDGSFSAFAVQHVVRCLGTICEFLRFGRSDTVERAITKLDRLANGFLHSRDPYSAILARLVGAVAQKYFEMSLWRSILEMQTGASSDTGAALEQFARAQFSNRRALIWPAQAAGITRLREGSSFALCTPTGSGKTTVATLGIISALFEPNPNAVPGLGTLRAGNLVLYIVPSRALAAEVEERLDQDLRGILAQKVVVTGLYGGTDWGPTDAWIAQDQPTILICTFEKADALLRFLGVLFLDRVRLVIIDEAHTVNYGKPEPQALQDGASRPYRLELLGTRLSLAREQYSFRTIALSAVAAEAAPSLARWISGEDDAQPTESRHRSTRQMLGRVEVSGQGAFTIRYDLMNGQSLKFNEGRTASTPYVVEPFPRMPGGLGPRNQPEVRMRAPTLWAALSLASQRTSGAKPTVLISIAQNIDSFAESCLNILDEWQSQDIPDYFDADPNDLVFADCLASVADYFSEDSFEYRLLSSGIYKTSLTPRSAGILLNQVPSVVDQLAAGADYGRWSVEDRFAFIVTVISQLDRVPSFRLSTTLGRARNFTDLPTLLRWWMCKQTLERQPTPKQTTVWFDYVSKNFLSKRLGLGWTDRDCLERKRRGSDQAHGNRRLAPSWLAMDRFLAERTIHMGNAGARRSIPARSGRRENQARGGTKCTRIL
jgi:hypothetical protein